ncbi:MAG: hypothetical protein IJR65_07780 [Oscillospiraceae bacterium]|nr:hypothetical protein [Oscillospiraceae bacterium]
MKRFLSILLTLALLLSAAPLLTRSARAENAPAVEAAETAETAAPPEAAAEDDDPSLMESELILINESDPEDAMAALRSALAACGDYTIRLLCDAVTSPSSDQISRVWATVGAGVKTLDLYGHRADLNAYDKKGRVTMLRIEDGAELRIVDTSGTNSGGLWNYARIDTPGSDGANFRKEHVKYRDVFSVSGGVLRIYAGTFEAGRSKEVYIYDGLKVDEWGFQEAGANKALGLLGDAITHYNGYAWMQVNGNCINQEGGQVFLYGGTFLGRGYQKFESRLVTPNIHLRTDWERGAAVNYSGGELSVLGGTYWGRGNANVFNVASNVLYNHTGKLTVYGGVFRNNSLETFVAPSLDTSLNDGPLVVEKDSDWSVSQEYLGPGQVGIPTICLPMVNTWADQVVVRRDGVKIEDAFWDNVNETEGVTTVEIVPRSDLPMTARLDGEAVDRTLYWDGDPETRLDLSFGSLWDASASQVPRYVWTMQSKAQLGSTPAVYIGGTLHYAGDQDELTVISTAHGSDSGMMIRTDGDGVRHLDGLLRLGDFMPAGMQPGDAFQIDVLLAELLPGADGSYGTVGPSAQWMKTIYVEWGEPPYSVIEQPQSVYTEARDEEAVLTAVCTTPDGTAYWERLSPTAERVHVSRVQTVNDGVCTTSTLRVSSGELASYRCVFLDRSGNSYRSEAAVVGYLPALSVTRTEVTAYTRQSVCRLIADADLAGVGSAELRWYRGNEPLENNGHYAGTGTTELHILAPKLSDAGVYTLRAGNRSAAEIHLTVIDGEPDNHITSLDLYLDVSGQLYVNDPAPTELTWERPGVKSATLTWTGGVADGKIASRNPKLSIYVKASYPAYWFKTDADGYFTWTLNGMERRSYVGNRNTLLGDLTLSFTYSDPLPLTPDDTVRLSEQSFDVPKDKPAELELSADLVCSTRHNRLHRITDVILDPVYPLPAGLELEVLEGAGETVTLRITGSCAEELTYTDPLVTRLWFYTDAGYDLYEPTNPISADLSFSVVPARETFSLALPPLHSHSCGDWTDAGDGTHSRVCAVCGAEFNEPHAWDEGVVTLRPTPDADGTVTFTCADCGAVRTEARSYEPGDLNVPFTVIRTLSVTDVVEPVAGEHPSQAGRVYLPVGEPEAELMNEGLWWFDLTDGFTLQAEDVFEAGHVYQVHVPVRVIGTAQFDLDGVYASINGRTAAAVTPGGLVRAEGLTLIASFGVCSGEEISHIELNNVTVPEPGAIALTTCDFGGTGYHIRRTSSGGWGYWHYLDENGESHSIYDETFRFAAGQSYRFGAILEASEGHWFADDLTITVNGVPLDMDEVQRPVPNLVRISVQFDWQPKYLLDVDLSLTLPKAGETPDYSAFSMNPWQYRVDETYGMYGNCYWYDSNAHMLREDEVFVAGETYTLEMRLVSTPTSDGYASDFDVEPTVRINGKALPENATVVSNPNDLWFSCNFVCQEAGPSGGSVWLSVMEPLEDRHPRRLCEGLPEGVTVTDFLWYDATERRYVTQDELFLAGHLYRVSLTLTNAEGLDITINGWPTERAGNVYSCYFPIFGVDYSLETDTGGGKLRCAVSGLEKFSATLLVGWYTDKGQLLTVNRQEVREDDPAWTQSNGLWVLKVSAGDVVPGAADYRVFLLDEDSAPLTPGSGTP